MLGSARSFSKSGKMFVSGSLIRPYPPKLGLQASVSVGLLNQCDVPDPEKVDQHLEGFGMAGASGDRGLGGAVNWSPSSGTSTQIGLGIGGSFSLGEISREDSWGGGW